MTVSFNLIDKPWIPCVDHQGRLVEVGLRDLLLQAHNLQAICCETPLMTAAVMPVVMALLHRVFGPEGSDEWHDLWEAGQFPSEPLEAYFKQWQNRFDLFHPEYPFYQVRDRRLEPQPILYLAESIRNSETLFNHSTNDNSQPLNPSLAILTLLTAQYFRVGGGRTGTQTPNLINGTLTSGIVFFANGNNLFKTLMLNLVRYPDEQIMPSTLDDKPVWENDDPFRNHHLGKQILNLVPNGYLDYLTWQTFHIELFPEINSSGNIVVPAATVIPVAKLDQIVHNPQHFYIFNPEKGDAKPIRFKLDRAMWRDYHSLLSFLDRKSNKKSYVPCAVLSWLTFLVEMEEMIETDYPFMLTAIGLITEPGKAAKILTYRNESIPIPYLFLRDEKYIHLINDAINITEKAAEILNQSIKKLARQVLMRGGNREPDQKKEVAPLIKHWNVTWLYWSILESKFGEFLDYLLQDTEMAMDMWRQSIRTTSHSALDAAIEMGGNRIGFLKGQVEANRHLNIGLKKLLD